MRGGRGRRSSGSGWGMPAVLAATRRGATSRRPPHQQSNGTARGTAASGSLYPPHLATPASYQQAPVAKLALHYTCLGSWLAMLQGILAISR